MGNIFRKEVNVKDKISKHLIPELADIVHEYYHDSVNRYKQLISKYFMKKGITVNIEGPFVVSIKYDSYHINYTNLENNIKLSFYWWVNTFAIYKVGHVLQYKFNCKVYDNSNDLLIDLKNDKNVHTKQHREYILS